MYKNAPQSQWDFCGTCFTWKVFQGRILGEGKFECVKVIWWKWKCKIFYLCFGEWSLWMKMQENKCWLIQRDHSNGYIISTKTFPPIEHKWTIDSWEAEDEAGEYLSINRDQAYGISKTHWIIHLQPSQTEPLVSEERKKMSWDSTLKRTSLLD